jgi:hypothetical protein
MLGTFGDLHRHRRLDLKINGVVVRARFSYGVSRVPVRSRGHRSVVAMFHICNGFQVLCDNQPRAKCSARAIRARCVRQGHSTGRDRVIAWNS